MKQTAVEWLEWVTDIELKSMEDGRMTQARFKLNLYYNFQKAKEMEKERMKGMYVEGSFAKMRYYDGLEYIDAEHYYNETFNTREK